MSFVNVYPPNPLGLTPEFGASPVPIFGTAVWNGSLSMSGVTKDSGGTPHQRMVYLFLYPAMNTLARQLSDPATGGFTWSNLRAAAAGTRYCMTAHKPDGSVNAGIHDNVVPV